MIVQIIQQKYCINYNIYSIGTTKLVIIIDDIIYLYNFFMFKSPLYGLSNTLLYDIYKNLREDDSKMVVYKKSYNQITLDANLSSVIISFPLVFFKYIIVITKYTNKCIFTNCYLFIFIKILW